MEHPHGRGKGICAPLGDGIVWWSDAADFGVYVGRVVGELGVTPR